MPDTYFPLHLSTPNPLKAVFRGPDGRALFSTSTDGRTTVIRRIYGRSAKTIRQQQDGLVLAEIEWMDRVRSSRIRFKGVDVDVRIDEYLKETRGGRSVPRFPNTPRLCIGSKCATNALSCVVASRECSPPPMDGLTSGKRVVQATVQSSSNARRENVSPAYSPLRTLPCQPLVHCPRRLRLPQLFSPPLLQRLCNAPLKCPAYPSRSPSSVEKGRNPLSGCTRVCSTS